MAADSKSASSLRSLPQLLLNFQFNIFENNPQLTALTACPFSVKNCAKMSVFLCDNRKNLLGATQWKKRRSDTVPI